MSTEIGIAEYKIFLERITIENFKSIKKLTLRLKPGVNLLVGPNRAGKSNILEAVYFLSKALSREELLKVPYTPHMYFSWKPEDLFYMERIENPIAFEMLFRITKKQGEEYLKHYIKITVKFSLSRDRHSVEPIYIAVDWDSTRVEAKGNTIKVYINTKYVNEYLEALNKASKVLSEDIRKLHEKAIGALIDKFTKIKESVTQKIHDEYIPFALAELNHENSVIQFILRNFWLSYDLLINIDTETLSLPRLAFEYARGEISIPILLKWSKAVLDEFKGWRYEEFAPEPFTFEPFESVFVIFEFLGKGVFLRHPDISAISEPQPFYGGELLDFRARNLPQILYKLFAERRTKVVEFLLNEVFSNVSIEVKSYANRVYFVIKESLGGGLLELPPLNIADGVVKVLAIGVAVELKPSILLIDEIENSLHIKALKVVFDLLNSLELPVIAATHSPILVDLANPERTAIVYRDESDSTVVEYFENPDEVKRRLSELGISFSDYIFYSKTQKPESR
jgi:energy-coupling factor transporter ATP-binding protein EcfA2